MSLETLKEAVLKKARERADKILKNAERKAEEIIESAKKEYFKKLEIARKKALAELKEEEYRKYRKKVMELNAETLRIKRELLKELTDEAVKKIKELPEEARRESLKNLLHDAISQGVVGGSFTINVVGRDLSLINEVLDELNLASRVTTVKELPEDFLGGVKIESDDGSVAVDNTYSTRMERALTIIYEKVNKEVFKG